ncbi:MAG TPA: peptidoglycan recognition family protein [Bryobacteraceae bacterium]|nr:peptidoglycan recognition family protein [Bryobacteraceae bacterium]
MSQYIPSLDRVPRIERRAQQIDDPVARLRYLRKEMSVPPARVVPVAARHRRSTPGFKRAARRAARRAIWLAFPLMMAISGPASKGVPETVAKERGMLVPRADAGVVTAPVPQVWRVEHSESTDVYSNGLRVDLTFVVNNRPRGHYPVYALAGASEPVATGDAPVGIVYHTTESHLAPFEEDENRRLKQLGRNLLEVIRTARAYHYVIDRFGRVFAVVAETDAANHVGNSVWADAHGIYVNLNDSFLGVSFEGQTDAPDQVTPAQVASGRVLTEMLRSRYNIAAEDCVTHAQVSVNPDNMLIGSHVDWASNFPFREMGLPDNYSIPLASIYAFGFEYDGTFLRVTGDRWKGLELAANQVDRQAALEGVPVARYRTILRHRYKDIAAALKQKSAQEARATLSGAVTKPPAAVRESKDTIEGAI